MPKKVCFLNRNIDQEVFEVVLCKLVCNQLTLSGIPIRVPPP